MANDESQNVEQNRVSSPLKLYDKIRPVPDFSSNIHCSQPSDLPIVRATHSKGEDFEYNKYFQEKGTPSF